MKNRIVYIALLMGGIACTDQTIDAPSQQARTLLEKLPSIGIRKSLSDVHINVGSFCPQQDGMNCAKELNQLQQQLMVLDPVPVPQLNVGPTISADEAVHRYNLFVAEHPGEPILAVFQQLFPRILLNKYGIIRTTNYSLIAYFTRQMVDSKALDFDTQTKALTVLQHHIPAGEFNALRNAIVIEAEQHKTTQQTYVANLQKPIDETSRAARLEQLIRPQMLASAKASLMALEQNIVSLRRL